LAASEKNGILSPKQKKKSEKRKPVIQMAVSQHTGCLLLLTVLGKSRQMFYSDLTLIYRWHFIVACYSYERISWYMPLMAAYRHFCSFAARMPSQSVTCSVLWLTAPSRYRLARMTAVCG